MVGKPLFALNHMVAPALGLRAFFDLADAVGVSAVEIRNDLAGQPILDGTPASEVRALAAERGMRILSINALQRFNDWTAERAREAAALIRYGEDCGAEALVLVPVNDGTGRADRERQEKLRVALRSLAPMLKDAGIRGYVEPLGFEACSLRSKAEAVEAIRSLGEGGPFMLVHDTFHHHLAGEPGLFPDWTGLVHVSGVDDAAVAVADLADRHRVLVERNDRLDNVGQIAALLQGGYEGPLSFEPFAPSVHRLDDIAGALKASMRHIEAGLHPVG